MTPASLLASARSLIEADPDAFGLIDRCGFITSGKASDGNSGHTLTIAEGPTTNPCLYEMLSGGNAEIVANGVTIVATHRIFTLITDEAMAVTEHDQIKVVVRDENTELIFEQPYRTKNTMLPIVEFKAILTAGYRQPGIT